MQNEPIPTNNQTNESASLDLPAEIFSESDKSLLGTILDTQYEILELKSKDKLGTVYLANYSLLNKKVVVIVLAPELIATEAGLTLFRQELQIASTLDHPNVIKIYGFGITGGAEARPYVVTEYLDNVSLATLIKQRKKLSLTTLLGIFKECCAGLEYAHGKGVIHKALSSGNINLKLREDGSYTVKIAGFSIANLVLKQAEQSVKANDQDKIFYRSPEQSHGRIVDKRADIYMLGCILYEALTLGQLQKNRNSTEIIFAPLAEVPDLFQIDGTELLVADKLESIIFKAVEKDPDKRFQSMTEFANNLRGLQSDLETGRIKHSPAVLLERNKRSLLRLFQRSPRVAFGVSLVLVLVGLSAYVVWGNISWFYAKHEFKPIALQWREEKNSKAEPVQKNRWERLRSYLENLKKDGAFDVSKANLIYWNQLAEKSKNMNDSFAELQVRQQIVLLMNALKMSEQADFAIANESLGACFLNQHDLFRALTCYTTACTLRERLNLRIPETYAIKADILLKLGRYQDARTEYYQAIRFFGNKNLL